MPLVSAADWLNSQSADRLNIRSADWPAARSSGDITQADQPTLQKPSAPSPLIRRHYTYNVLASHKQSHYTTYTHNNNSNITRSPATSRPLNGHFAITLFPLIRWRSRLALFSSLLHLILTLSIFIHHPGVFLGPPPGRTAW